MVVKGSNSSRSQVQGPDVLAQSREGRGVFYNKLRMMLKNRESGPQTFGEGEPEPPKRKTALLVMGSESDDEALSTDNCLERYKAGHSVRQMSTTVVVST